MKTLELLEKEKVLTIKEISEKTEISERNVRYDIEKINFFLSSNKSPLIEKASKGYVFLPTDFDIQSLYDEQEYSFSKQERIEILLLFALINTQRMNLNTLSDRLQVSRSTLKNDIKEVDQILEEYDLKLVYENGFVIHGNSNKYLIILYQTIKKYNYLFISGIYKFKAVDAFIEEIFLEVFNGVHLKEVAEVLRRYLSNHQLILSDDSFEWYFTNMIIVIWSSITSWSIQFEYHEAVDVKSLRYAHPIEELENIMGITFSEEEKSYLSYLLNYTNTYALSDGKTNVQAETITFQLIDKMSTEMGIDFHSDEDLFSGLISHVAQLIKRLQDHMDISEDVSNILTVRDLEVYEILSRVVKEIEFLETVENETELTYLTVYFLASIRRIKDDLPKNILVVCGYGYGTSVMLKETLMNDFHIRVLDTLPVYLLKKFKDWNQVDLVISTIELDASAVGKEIITVNPILTDEDIRQIIDSGITRKKNLTHYYSINRNLEFLHEKKRAQVLEVIRNEFGYPKTTHEEKPYKFSDLISENLITFIDGNESWTEVVKLACGSLYREGYTDNQYTEEIIDSVKKMGYYSVSDDNFALLHGRPSNKIQRSGISLVVSKEKIRFGEKKVNIVFCLASKDYKEHVPALVSLVRMIKCTGFIEEISQATTAKELISLIEKNERKI